MTVPVEQVLGIVDAKGACFTKFLPTALNLTTEQVEEVIAEVLRRYPADVALDSARGVLYQTRPRASQPFYRPEFRSEPFNLTFSFKSPTPSTIRGGNEGEEDREYLLCRWLCPQCSFSDAFHTMEPVGRAVRVCWAHLSAHAGVPPTEGADDSGKP